MSIGRYERPLTIEAAVELLSNEKGTAEVLAGGSDLIAAIRTGYSVDLLVDIKKLPGISGIRWEPDGTLFIGACTSVQSIAADPSIRQRYPVLSIAAGNLGSYQVRCRATIAGNLGNASPCADNAPALLVLGARVHVATASGQVDTPLDGFILNVKKTALQRGDIIVRISIPPNPPNLRSGFLKIKRTCGHDMALVNAAAAYDPDSREFRLAIGSAACTPVLIHGLEGICPPGATAAKVGDRLAERAIAAIQPIDDVRATAEYRRDMTALLCRRLAAALIDNGCGQ